MPRSLIITDSSSDLPENLPSDLPLKVLNMAVTIKGKPNIDISVKEFYNLMRKDKILPTTAKVNVITFMELFEKCINENIVPIVIGLSSKLSGSFESALLAKQNLGAKDNQIIIIDSKCASLGLGLVVMKAAKMAKAQQEPSQIAKTIEHYAHHMEHIFTVDSLDHLKRGGRISSTKAFVGGLLHIKPILHFVDGAIVPLEKIRGKKNVIKHMIKIMRIRGKNLENQVVGVSHGDNEVMAKELAEAVVKQFNVKGIVMSQIGPVVGSHSGPGTVAVFFQNQ